jgi:fibro-slime domain-containing protein
LNLTRLFVLAIGAAFTTLACIGPEPLGSSLQSGGASGSHGPNPGGGIDLNPGSGAGSIASTGTGGAGGDCQNQVIAVIRDFRGWDSQASDPGGAATKHPDFEPAVKTAEKGIVAAALGSPDQKPMFSGTAQTVTSADTFNQWYRDTDGVNVRFEIPLPLTPDPLVGGLVYDNETFFPIDNQGWGNQGQTHNYSFTTEIHTTFTYKGGEKFTFKGDDDVFVYVNNQLVPVLDLGGIHKAETGTADFDQLAATLGLTKGQTYHMDIFHAERHVTESHFKMTTKFECLTSYVVVQ